MSALAVFLNLLFPELVHQFIEIRCLKKGASAFSLFYGSVEALLSDWPKIQKIDQSHDVYVGVCPRNTRSGDKSAITDVCAVWVDMDAKNFSGGKPEMLKRIHEFPLSSSVIVDSGYGIHAYWCLKEPFLIGNKGDANKIEAYLKRLAITLNGDKAVADVTRILRLPGTYNHKRTPPVLVRLIKPEGLCQSI